MDKIYVFGHKKPDTDSVCGSIALAYLKKQIGINAEARILSDINKETNFALNYFGIPKPKFLNDVKVEIKDIKYKRNYYVNEDDSIFNVYNYMKEKGLTGIPLVDSKKIFKGYVSFKEIANELIMENTNILNSSFDNIKDTLNASKVYKFDEKINGIVQAIAVPFNKFAEIVSINEKSILIVGNRLDIVKHSIQNKAKLIILVANQELTKEEVKLVKENKVNVIVTPYDTFKTCRLINLSNPIKLIKRAITSVCFDPHDYLTDFIDVSNKLKHTNYPIVTSKGVCDGMLRITDIHDYSKKKIILVDHNDPKQSVDGLEEAEILEIIDHHNIGDISTFSPINFRNMTVGSVNTIIYTLFLDYNIKIPKEIAGLMLSGILSDTLILVSPTTTELDRQVVSKLAKLAKVDYEKYGLELLSSGVSIEGQSAFQIVNRDFKSYSTGNYSFGISQTFTANFNQYRSKINEIVDELDKMAYNNNYKVVCLFVTDILTNDSYLVYNSDGINYLKMAFNLSELKQGEKLKGIISRKKQMVPPIMEVFDRK